MLKHVYRKDSKVGTSVSMASKHNGPYTNKLLTPHNTYTIT